jgi:hypothetical protein
MSDDIELVATFNQGMEAELAKAKLQSEGIESFVADEGIAASFGSVLADGIKLMVRSSDAQRARAVLGV